MLTPQLAAALGPRTAPSAADRFRQAANWVNLSTPLGLIVARSGGARLYRGPRGYLLADGYAPRFPVAPAFAVGDVLISRRPWPDRVLERPELLAHEAAHSWQYVATLGLPFLPLYGAAVAWSWLRTGDTGARNVFERWAGLRRGGYPDALPVRPLAQAARELRGLLGGAPRG